MDNILLSCGSSSNVTIDGRVFVSDNTSTLVTTTAVGGGGSSVAGSTLQNNANLDYPTLVSSASVNPLNDSKGLYHNWEPDSSYLFAGATGTTGSILFSDIKYGNDPTYIAPPAVYATARTLGGSQTDQLQIQLSKMQSLNGLEIFKMNNSDGGLSGPNPSVAVSSPTSMALAPPTGSSKSNMGVIIGAAVGGVAVVGLLVAFICYCCCRKPKAAKKPSTPMWLPLPLKVWPF
ncbi:unnamed protein product [Sphagnum troendelagicum]|uniref:Uncharacterized protein n=1 Tax=Sphagnum troendelagicum TaxID=128251 RepID=A0ABP0TVQ9_9BRYO